MLFAETVILHRVRNNLTQLELAERLGVRQQTVSRWESGTAIPPPPRVTALEDELGLERGTLHRLVGNLPVADGSVAEPTIRRMVTEIPTLDEDELVEVIDAAWQTFRARRGLDAARARGRSPAPAPRSD